MRCPVDFRSIAQLVQAEGKGERLATVSYGMCYIVAEFIGTAPSNTTYHKLLMPRTQLGVQRSLSRRKQQRDLVLIDPPYLISRDTGFESGNNPELRHRLKVSMELWLSGTTV